MEKVHKNEKTSKKQKDEPSVKNNDRIIDKDWERLVRDANKSQGSVDDEPWTGHRHPHRPLDGSLEDRQAFRLPVRADQEDLAALIGREGEAAAALRQPAHELA